MRRYIYLAFALSLFGASGCDLRCDGPGIDRDRERRERDRDRDRHFRETAPEATKPETVKE
jgi:hypothetical protein